MTLPGPLARYFLAQNARDVDAMTDCFAVDATVLDEDRTYCGRDSIRGWKVDALAHYAPFVEPLDAQDRDGICIVTARVTGTFPGSPIKLTYRFGLDPEGLIRTLEVG